MSFSSFYLLHCDDNDILLESVGRKPILERSLFNCSSAKNVAAETCRHSGNTYNPLVHALSLKYSKLQIHFHICFQKIESRWDGSLYNL